jgi:hypothetical protein
VYKPLSGVLSSDEYAILDELNGLVLAGEIALERLQRSGNYRLGKSKEKFNNHYELAAYIFENLGKHAAGIPLGRVDVLLKYLQYIKEDKPEFLERIIRKLPKEPKDISISEQIVDSVISGNKDLYEKYEVIKREVEENNPYFEITFFTSRSREEKNIWDFLNIWIQLEKTIRENWSAISPHRGTPRAFSYSSLFECFHNDPDLFEKIQYVRRIRNKVVHGIEDVSIDEILKGKSVLESIIQDISNKLEIKSKPAKAIKQKKKK